MVRKKYAQGVGLYRQFFGILATLSHWIGKTSYSLSVVILVLAIAGGMANQHSLAVFGISVIVLLNVVALAAAVVNLAMRAFQKSPMEGVLVLIPPINIGYLWRNWPKYRKSVGRIVLPAASLCVVVVAYMFVPWLNGGKPIQGTLEGQIRGAVQSLEHDVDDSASEAAKTAKEGKIDLSTPMNEAKTMLEKAQDAVESGLDELKEKDGTGTRGKAADGSKPNDAGKPVQNGNP